MLLKSWQGFLDILPIQLELRSIVPDYAKGAGTLQ